MQKGTTSKNRLHLKEKQYIMNIKIGGIVDSFTIPFYMIKEGLLNMPRLARKNLETHFLHVMVQGVNREYIFKNKKNIEMYLNMIKENAPKCNYAIIQ